MEAAVKVKSLSFLFLNLLSFDLKMSKELELRGSWEQHSRALREARENTLSPGEFLNEPQGWQSRRPLWFRRSMYFLGGMTEIRSTM